ncbi:DUF2169 family type VI secretion system accessory protein [Tateyamaria sp. SN6-1]|uniref:DUF2169 family type VI secretion system accessory protein n=1 Tax=Tateyamaria sp. SN6-1 TaxID=3092148 RepID=UPI0039F4F7A6
MDNTTPFPDAKTFLRDVAGNSLWVIGIKATFAFRDGKPCLFTPDQIEPCYGPVFADDDTQRDMLSDTDITLPKGQVDVIVDATAYPPREAKPEQPYLVQLNIGNVTKTIQVAPPSVLTRWQGVTPVKNVPHDPVPLHYTQSFGGPRTAANPIGLGDDPKADGDTALMPRLSLPGKPMTQPKSPVPPAALTAIPRSWAVRDALSGTYDEDWQRRRSPLMPMDLQPEYWQAAPPDQRLDRAAAQGASVTLTNMTSNDGTWADPPVTFTLPHVGFDIMCKFRGQWETLTPELQTINIAADKQLVSLFYIAMLPIQAGKNDVLVEHTTIALNDSSGFRVQPEHASFFVRDFELEEAV